MLTFELVLRALAASLTLWPTKSQSRHSDPLHRRPQQLRCLDYCSDCSRVERTSSRVTVPATRWRPVMVVPTATVSHLLLIWLTQQTPMGSVKGCQNRHFPRPCGNFKTISLPRKPANITSQPAVGPMVSSVPAAEIGELINWGVNGGGSAPAAVTKSR